MRVPVPAGPIPGWPYPAAPPGCTTPERAPTRCTAAPVGAQHVAPARPRADPRPRPDDDLPTVISVANLSKVNRAGDIDGRTQTENLARRWAEPGGWRDLSFDVGRGSRGALRSPGYNERVRTGCQQR